MPYAEQPTTRLIIERCRRHMEATAALTRNHMLYLAVDMGDNPNFGEFAEQVRIVNQLQSFLFRRAELAAQKDLPKNYPVSEENLRNFIDALTERSNSLVPPSYSEIKDIIAKLLEDDDEDGLPYYSSVRHSGLKVVRTSMASPWVTVLSDVAANSKPILYGGSVILGLHTILNMVIKWRAHVADIRDRDAARPSLIPSRDVAPDEIVEHFTKATDRTFMPPDGTDADMQAFEEVSNDLRNLGTIITAEMISENDPRIHRDL